jgi:CelD/BcsL family acetyltransferase involved in cellulose biosynthesis
MPAPLAIESRSITATTHSRSAWTKFAPTWSQLAEASPSSFFLSSDWTETWLEVFGPELDPSLITLSSAGQTVGACLITGSRRRLIPLKTISLNAAGESSGDTTYIEYNDLLSAPGWESRVAEAIAHLLARERWDELRLAGFCDGEAYRVLRHAFEGLDLEEQRHSAYYVDLGEVRRSGSNYASFLRNKTGKRLRQNLRYYESAGPLRLETATNVDSALQMLNEMAGLSQKRLESLARRSVFTSPRFSTFHHRLIERCLPQEKVQLLRVTSGGETVGIVYNLIHRQKVCFYQCGYRYGLEKRLSPGRVTLALAIQHCIEAGYDEFDFLSGELQYKESMSTGSRPVIWATFRRPGMKSAAIKTLRRIFGRRPRIA